MVKQRVYQSESIGQWIKQFIRNAKARGCWTNKPMNQLVRVTRQLPRINASMDRWTQWIKHETNELANLNQWMHRNKAKWVNASMEHWITETMKQSHNESTKQGWMNRWVHKPMGRNQCIGEAESMKSLGHGKAAMNRRIHGSIYCLVNESANQWTWVHESTKQWYSAQWNKRSMRQWSKISVKFSQRTNASMNQTNESKNRWHHEWE